MNPVLKNIVFNIRRFPTLVTNGDINNGATGWTTNGYGTISSSNNELIYTPIAIYNQVLNLGSYIAGHIYYCCAYIKSASGNIKFIMEREYAYDQTISVYSGSGNYEKLSGIVTMADPVVHGHIGVIDFKSSGFTPIYIKYAIAVDLTAKFGAGSEPSLDWCNYNIK